MTIRWISVFVVCLVLGWVVMHQDGLLPSHQASGGIAPAFKLQDMQGNWIDSKDFESKVRLISFWASWCEPCIVEMPELVELHDKFKDRGFTVLGVNVEDENAFGKVKLFTDRHRISFPILRDVYNEAVHAYGVHSLPHNFLVGRDSKIILQDSGYQRWTSPNMLEKIENLLTSKE